MNESYIFNQIRRFNSARSRLHQDAALARVGIHVELIDKRMRVATEISSVERKQILYFLKMFCSYQKVSVEFKD